jgi:uncharacterized protein
MNSRLYTGWVAHSRSVPVRNSFSYRVYFCYLDLDELPVLGARLRRFAYVPGDGQERRRALVSFHDRDHGPRDGSALRGWIEGHLARAGVDLEGGPVRVLSIPRVLGGRFYPVSFWYCFHADGTPRAVLAEVQNTFRDHHSYLLHNDGLPFSWDSHPRAPKAFYVSPFVPQQGVGYVFTFSEPGEEVFVSVTNRDEEQLLMSTTLSLRAQDLTDGNLLRAVVGLGPMSARALVLIHWQALRLFLKKVPYHGHERPAGEELSLHATGLAETEGAGRLRPEVVRVGAGPHSQEQTTA